MSKFHEWVVENDQQIKSNIVKVSQASGVKAKFLGYYLEDNDHSYSMEARPMYQTLEEYIEDNPKRDTINHVRYFFKLFKNDQSHTLTAHIYESDNSNFLFSIEELAETATIPDVQKVIAFEIIQTLVSKKFTPYLVEIEKLQADIDGCGKLDDDILNKINYKLRLDWNYYSNRMEGGTLTRPETKQVMAGVSVAAKPLNDVKEMSGHDKAVQEILHISKGNMRISEKRMKSLHHLIMNEDDDKKAALIGKWKKENNEVINYKGEKQLFQSWKEVPEAIHKLLDRTNAELDAYFAKKKNAKHPLFIASDFHLDFLYIHPFYDGNGRSARLLTNLILISCGYPPIIITDATKEVYYRFISEVQSYGADKELFYSLMGNQMVETQKLILNAIEGKDLSDEDDFDKELALLKNQLGQGSDKIELEHGQVDMKKFIQDNFTPVIDGLIEKGKKLSEFYKSNQIDFRIGNLGLSSNLSKAKVDFMKGIEMIEPDGFHSLKIEIDLLNFIKNGLQTFNTHWKLEASFDKVKYSIEFNSEGAKKSFEKLYHQHLTLEEGKNIIDAFGHHVLNEIKRRVQKK